MRFLVVGAAVVAGVVLASQATAQPTCLRPKWTECVSFPSGGRHTGIDAYGKRLEAVIPAGSEVCVRNEWEIRAETYVQFSLNGAPWPNPDWEVDEDTFCLYKN